MQVENNYANTSVQYIRGAQSAQTTAKAANNRETASAETANSPEMTGTTGSSLSSEVMSKLIEAQEADSSNTEADDYEGPLLIGQRHYLEDIAKDPEYAAKKAEELGRSGDLVLLRVLPTVNNGFSVAEREAFMEKYNARISSMKQVQESRIEYYESLKTQGLQPAEMYAKILEFNANLPESYDAEIGYTESGMKHSYSEINQAHLDYLQSLIG